MPSIKTIWPERALAGAAGLAASAGLAAGAAGAVVAAGAPEAGLESAGWLGAAWPHAASTTAPVARTLVRRKRRRENAVPEIVIDLPLSVRRAAGVVASAFDPTEHDPLNEVALPEEEQHQHRQHRHDRGGHDQVPFWPGLGLERLQTERDGVVVSGVEVDQRAEEVVPGDVEDVDRHHHQGRPRERQDDLPIDPEA